MINLDNVSGVIFDLDGTLVDSMWMWKSIDIEYLSRFGIDIPDDLQASIEGKSFSETAVYFKERFNIPDSLDTIKNNWNQMAYDKYRYEIKLKDGVLDFLQLLKDKNIKMGIATSNSKELALACLEGNNILEYFDTIVTGSEVYNGKPNPDIYLLASKNLSINPSNCLVFEDVIQGIQAGLNAGMTVFAVKDDYSMEFDDEKKELADFYINSFEELLG